MEGENTGPINIGNPGYPAKYDVPIQKHCGVLTCDQVNVTHQTRLLNLQFFLYFTGEFTMIELAENVKEVSDNFVPVLSLPIYKLLSVNQATKEKV